MAHAARVITELDPETTLVTVNEIEAYDLIRRKAMLARLKEESKLRTLFSFVRMSYGSSSQYS